MLSTSKYLGGITRPRDLRVIARSRGGHLERIQPNQSLLPDTDTPTLLERVPGSSRESGSPQILQRSFEDPAEAVDTTQSPWLPQQTHKPIHGSGWRTVFPCETTQSLFTDMEVHLSFNAQPRSTSVSHVDVPHLAPSNPRLSFVSQHTRSFHTSPRVPYDSTSYNVSDVPDFFIKYKQHRARTSTDLEARERGHEELGLMESLSDSILLGDVVASTRRLRAKIPVEHYVAEGRVIHPSGFVVPGPGHTSTSDVARAKERERNERDDRAAQTAAVAYRVLESDFDQVDATTLPSLHKVPFEVREPDGIIKHPSGFVPPTPAHKFRYTVNTIVSRDHKVSSVRQKAGQPSPPRAVLRAIHTASAPNTSGDV